MTKDGKFNLVGLLNSRSVEESKKAEPSGNEGTGKGREIRKEEVMMIDVRDLVPSRENFYLVDDGLKESIRVAGVLQPLLVNRPKNGKYKVIAGHRRRLAVLALLEDGEEERRYVPCIYKKEDVQDGLAIIMANRFRDKTDWERMMEVVEAEKLAKELMKAFKADRIRFSIASELCGLPQEWQESAGKMLERNGALSLSDIKELKRKKEGGERSLKESAAERDTGAGQTEPRDNEKIKGSGAGREWNVSRPTEERRPQEAEEHPIGISSMLYEEIISGKLRFFLLNMKTKIKNASVGNVN